MLLEPLVEPSRGLMVSLVVRSSSRAYSGSHAKGNQRDQAAVGEAVGHPAEVLSIHCARSLRFCNCASKTVYPAITVFFHLLSSLDLLTVMIDIVDMGTLACSVLFVLPSSALK